MTLTKEQIAEFEKHNLWLKMASKCEHAWQQYHGAPAPLPTCRLTDDACRYETCPKRREGNNKK